MEQITEYLVVSGKLEQVIADVNSGITNGLEPIGGLTVRPSPEGILYHQAMVRKVWDNTPPEFRAAMQR